ncbi:MAG TPA: esterase-like activity of phytase family protein [Allosphingosinicella sp.]|nr:esterase-like activity of phytase family protein [Allosphingosinicella sp.]
MSWSVERLEWADAPLGEIALPKKTMRFRSGFGSGLSRRPGDPPGTVWAVGDRGPNIKVKTAILLYGLDRLEPLRGEDGAKIMPRLDLGPAIAELNVAGDRVEIVRSLRIADSRGRPVSGLPVPGGAHMRCEPAFDLDGNPLPPDPSGLDTEGLAALADGGFWVSDEFGPSLVRLDSDGKVLKRLVPEGLDLAGAAYPVAASLPALASRRQLNRGFEAIALSPDGRWLFLAFQSPLAHPDEAAHAQGRHVRLWRLDSDTGEVAAQYLYPLDPPETFRRDRAKAPLERSDLKVSEICCVDADSLLVLERGSETTKIYKVTLAGDLELAPEHLDPATRPTVEEISAGEGGFGLPSLGKRLLFSSDDAPEVGADLEGMAILSPSELLLVNDNDFGVEGTETGFWRVRFHQPLLA